MKTINKNFVILFLVFLGISAFRLLLNDNPHIDKIVACINAVSFLYVFYLILDSAEEHLEKLIKECNLLGDTTKKKKKRHFKKYSDCVCIILFIISVIYILFWSQPVINDIIGFFALFFSIETQYIASCIGEFFFKMR